jgi:hypothetical protein
MAQPSNRFEPQHWRERAIEARANAARMNDPNGKRLMLEIAVSYDQLAKKAEEGEAK